ncbi:nucleotide sugar dehydrogenase [Daejeonella sp. H1SJ63]|jgi:UDP-N-acetyl-D-galactosamine dehydrogenase|uniref:nucleotide sugar dehydrogenase n=1 Tax=Daejeonella sp. H1SJ63 TaxID=3034145 RepID=UPI0023EC756C|nr:nucleotide sugar dehydrogenase [Daejeonella sp. H1SJ63]
MLPQLSPDLKIGIIGLGYVGLPLALAFSEKYNVFGYDSDIDRINSLLLGIDKTLQTSEDELIKSNLVISADPEELRACTIYIITVPTPIDQNKKPDLSPLLSASEVVGKLLKDGDIVIYESTVYPGCTEEDCVPVLERVSKLTYNLNFFCAYSPERVSPGDPVHTLKSIIKVTSGSTPETADFVDSLYASIIRAGTHKASSIKIAEASKAIENAQRDVNISFVNELALMFDKMDIDTTEVLSAAATKWNFLNFKPGLVGGHCIGVDPYYLAYKAELLGYHPRVILSGRNVNDQMASFVVNKCIKLMVQKNIQINGSGALLMGITFKENCPDIRNSKVIEIVNELRQFGIDVDVYDPLAEREQVAGQYDISLITDIHERKYQLIILAVAHDEFLDIDFGKMKYPDTILFDTRAVLKREWVDGRL